MEDLVLQKEKTESINLELIRADEELKAINEHLDHIVHVRTADLVKANQELDRFVYSASHDLSAPLKSILGLIRLARLEPDRASLATSLNYMERSVLRLDSVIRSLTQFSRNHGVEVTLIDFSMNRLVDEVIDDLEQSISTCRVVVRRSFGHEAVMHSDFFRVKIILMNLVSNAIKFRKEDAPETIVEIGLQTAEPGYTLSVTDYGIGIGDEHQPRVFEMFFRANTDREGSGLGLYIVNEMVARLGGSIAVRSAAGVYTTFEVRLPKHPLP
jgi:signal transduction histidine kinase